MRAEWPETGQRDTGADLGRHLVTWCVIVAAAVYSCDNQAGAKPCPLSHPYNKTSPCAAVPGCHLTPAPASLHGQLEPVSVLQNSTHYNGSILLNASALAWTDLDIEGNRMAVSWWGGLRLFQLSAAGQASTLLTLDGYRGDFPSWLPPLSEIDQVFGAVTIPDGDPSFAVLGGIQPGGVVIVDLGTGPIPQATVRYQDAGQAIGGTMWGTRIGGRSYAWVGTTSGVVGYDLTRTRELGCDRSCVGGSCSAPGTPCAGVRLPAFGSATQYVGGVVTAAGRALLVRSSGVYFPKSAELWDVTNPFAPILVGSVAGQSFGAASWQHGDAAGTVYVAARQQAGVRVWRLDSAGSLVDTGKSVGLHYPAESAQYLPLSQSWASLDDGKRVPFVFAGHADGCKEAAEPPQGYEALIRLADPHRPEVLDVADVSPRQLVTFESYTSPGGPPPPVASRTVDYWSWYTPNHEWGWSSVWPRVARFYGDILFRAAHTVGDSHRWRRPPPSGPEPIFADGFEGGSEAAWSAVVP